MRTDISPSDFELLFLHLLSKPDSVLKHFAAAQIGCLSQIEGWDAMKISDPYGAARIIFVAATLGIPEHLP